MDNVAGEIKQWQKNIMNGSFAMRVQKGNDPVNHPSHYTDGKIEVIEFIEDKNLGFHLGNAVKYISRAGKKDPNKEIEDLEKARWYLDRRIEQLKKDRIDNEAVSASGDTDGDEITPTMRRSDIYGTDPDTGSRS